MARSRAPNRGKGRPRRSGTPGTFTLAEVAAVVGGRVHRASRRKLTGVAPLETAGPGDLSWVADERRSTDAATSGAGALLVAEAVLAGEKPCVVVAAPPLALARWLEEY